MISNLLKTQTSEKHSELESLMFVNKIMSSTLTVDDYKKLLAINYIIHEKLEKKLTDMLDPGIEGQLQMNDRVKLLVLEHDLAYWGMDKTSLSGFNFDLFIPAKNNPEVLGALYVLEGATLGGNVIKKQILKNPSFAGREGGLNYYGVYGADLVTKWKTFVTVLDKSVQEQDYQICIDSANHTFDNLIRLSRQYP